jgi:hypothetical protein
MSPIVTSAPPTGTCADRWAANEDARLNPIECRGFTTRPVSLRADTQVRGRPYFAAVSLVLALAASGCAVVKPTQPDVSADASTESPAPSMGAGKWTRHGRKRGPIPTRALNVAADCAFKDETGYSGVMKLKVADAEVHAFEAKVDIPGRGACNFNLRDFRQTARMPNVALSAQRSQCIVRMWEQGRRVTVAFNNCQDRCSGEAYSYLWPIMADAQTGSCG